MNVCYYSTSIVLQRNIFFFRMLIGGGGGCGGRELGSNGGGRSTKDARKYRGREREKKRNLQLCIIFWKRKCTKREKLLRKRRILKRELETLSQASFAKFPFFIFF